MVGTQGDSPDEFVRYKPIRIGSQSGRGVVLTENTPTSKRG